MNNQSSEEYMLRISLPEVKVEDLQDHKESIYGIIAVHGLKDAVNGWGFDSTTNTLEILIVLNGIYMDAQVIRDLSTYNTNMRFSW